MYGDVRDGPNEDFEATFEKSLFQAVERKDDSTEKSIIDEQWLAERLVELQEAAESGRLSVPARQRGLTKILHFAAEDVVTKIY